MARIPTVKLNRTIKLRIDGRLLTALTDEIKRRGIAGLSLSHLVREILSTWAHNGRTAK